MKLIQKIGLRYQAKKSSNLIQRLLICFGFLLLFVNNSCKKIEYTQIEQPAYLRIFNNLKYKVDMDLKDSKSSFFCVLINPTIDEEGKPRSAEIVGDFLDVRNSYAAPYPTFIGSSSSVYNPEFPGKENILVGPMLNGFDLSSWAQVPSGKVRIMFIYRPKNNVGYFQLEEKLQGDVLIDTTFNLEAQEVYTLNLLQKDFMKRTNTVVIRKENFYKQNLSDSLVYVNFYNYSADGFEEADNSLKETNVPLRYGIKDTMNVFLTLYDDEATATKGPDYLKTGISGNVGKYITTMNRNITSGQTAAYRAFPLWANPKDNGIRTKSWQRIDFFHKNLSPEKNPYYSDKSSEWAAIAFVGNGTSRVQNMDGFLPNMLVNIHSGRDNPRTFATVNTIEVVNSYVYLTTIQRKYQPPIY